MNATKTTKGEKYKETLVLLDSIKIEEDPKTPDQYRAHIVELTRSIYLTEKTKTYIQENRPTVFGYDTSTQDIVVVIEDGHVRSYHKQINGINRVLFLNEYVYENACKIADIICAINIFESTQSNDWVRNVVLEKAKELIYDSTRTSPAN